MSERYIGGLVYNPPGGWSGSFSGSGQYLTLPSGSAFAFGTGDFTVECFAYINSFPSNPGSVYFVDARNSGQTGTWAFLTSADGTNSARFDWYTGSSVINGTVLPSSTWLHLVYTRSSSTYGMFVNGIRVATGTDSTNYSVSPTTSYIASRFSASDQLNGYMSNLRVVKGSSVYSPSSTTLTVPTGALLPITNTVLLTCRYPTFVDGSASPITLTNVGTATVSTTNPFPTSVLPNPALGGAGNGIYTLSQYSSLLGAGTWPAYDPYYENVTLNLHGNAGAVLPFNTDASTNNFQVTQVGNTSPSNYTPFIENGYWSNYFGGSGNSLNYPSASQYAIGTGNFTVEFFVNFASLNAGHNRMFCIGASGTDGLELDLNGTNFEVGIQNGYPIGYTWTPTAGTWYYIAVTRSGSTVTLYINGTSVATGTSSNNISQNSLSIGGISWVGSWSINGYLSNVRLSNTVRTIAVPTAPYTSDANTLFLGAQSNRFLDNSSYAATATPTGSPAVNPLQPFTAPTGTSAYGSGYFDGSGDYLTVAQNSAFNFGTGAFTVEAFVYLTAYPSGGKTVIFSLGNGADVSPATYTGWALTFTSSQITFYRYDGTETEYVASAVIPLNSWSHVVAVRNGSSSLSIYLNGVRVLNTTSSLSYNNVNSNNLNMSYWTSGGGTARYITGYVSNARIVAGTAVYDPTVSTLTIPTSPLTAVSGTSLLTVQTNAPSQNNTFLDSSTNNFVITRNGNTTQGTFTPYGSNWSNYFDGSGDYLSIASNAANALGSGDFTIQFWFYLTGTTGIGSSGEIGFVGCGIVTASRYTVRLQGTSTRVLSWWLNTPSNNVVGTTPISLNTWYHVAWVRSGSGSNNVKLYLNGVLESQGTSTYNSPADGIVIGRTYTNLDGEYTNGYLSNMQMVVGSALYTSAFTPPTTPLTAVTNTAVLTCQSNRFIDNSTNAFAITVNGSPSVQRFSPFSPTTAYSTSVIGGSGYFDGSGDYLSTTASTVTGGDFTIEAWVYLTALSGNIHLFSFGTNEPNRFSIYRDNTNNRWSLAVVNSGSYTITAGTSAVIANAWNHVAWVRSGSTNYLCVNGVREASNTASLNSGTSRYIAGNFGGSLEPITGYISDFRVSTSALYTGTTYTVPTAPFSAGAGTNMLLSYTNAGILDNAMMNDLETVGNAQISTSVKKYGTGSIAFDGSGDSLIAANVTNLGFGTGDFTVECWAYWNSPVSDGGFIGSVSNGGMDFAYLSNSLRIGRINTAWDSTFSSWTPTANTWYHIAFTRSGSTARAFVNGTQIGSNSTNANSYNPTGGMNVGVSNGTDRPFNGYIDDLRITKGVARYTTNFTPPTSQLQDQ